MSGTLRADEDQQPRLCLWSCLIRSEERVHLYSLVIEVSVITRETG